MTMTDLLTGEVKMPVMAAFKELGLRPPPSNVHRWIHRGITAGGRTHKLMVLKMGGRQFTTTTAIKAFLAAQQADADPPAPPARTPAKRKRASLAAEAKLIADGC